MQQLRELAVIKCSEQLEQQPANFYNKIGRKTGKNSCFISINLKNEPRKLLTIQGNRIQGVVITEDTCQGCFRKPITLYQIITLGIICMEAIQNITIQTRDLVNKKYV